MFSLFNATGQKFVLISFKFLVSFEQLLTLHSQPWFSIYYFHLLQAVLRLGLVLSSCLAIHSMSVWLFRQCSLPYQVTGF